MSKFTVKELEGHTNTNTFAKWHRKEPGHRQIWDWPSLAGIFWVTLRHDDVIRWKHFPRYWPFARGFHRSPVNSPHKGQWRGALMFSLISARINGCVNNNEAGVLRRPIGHYDVSVMEVSHYRIRPEDKQRLTSHELWPGISANTQRNKHVIITSKRCFDVIITCLLRCVFARMALLAEPSLMVETENTLRHPMIRW